MDLSLAEKKKMDNNKLLPTSVSVSVVQKKLIVMASAVPPLTAFHLVNLWTLLNAFAITLAFAYGIADRLIISTRYASSQPVPMSSTDMWMSSCCRQPAIISQMSSTDDAADDVLFTAWLWCSTPQAVAGTLALLLPCHWRRLRRVSAYAGVAVTVAGNCILGAHFVANDTGNLVFRIVGNARMFMFAVGDLLVFLALVHGAAVEEKQA